MPSSLMVTPCTSVDAGDTVRLLAKAYVQNNSCIQQYQLLIDSQRKWTASQLLIYKTK